MADHPLRILAKIPENQAVYVEDAGYYNAGEINFMLIGFGIGIEPETELEKRLYQSIVKHSALIYSTPIGAPARTIVFKRLGATELGKKELPAPDGSNR